MYPDVRRRPVLLIDFTDRHYLSNQPVADLGDRLDHSGMARVVPERPAQLCNGIGNGVLGDDHTRPEALLHFAATDHMPRTPGQVHQHLHRLGFQPRVLAAAGHHKERWLNAATGDLEWGRGIQRLVVQWCGRTMESGIV